jgi:hypothetical protein
MLLGQIGGRRWEQSLARAFAHAGGWCHQGPGHLHLFGDRSASQLRHELDGAGARGDSVVMTEAKAHAAPLSKFDLCCFDRKTFDFYVGRRRGGHTGSHHRVFVSSQRCPEALCKYAFLYGIVTVDPTRLPLPLLLRMAGRPAADSFFSDIVLSELVRLGEPACAPLERRYAPDGPHHIRFDIRTLQGRDLDDLLWLQDTVTADLLELVDADAPDYFEREAQHLFERIGIHDCLEAGAISGTRA